MVAVEFRRAAAVCDATAIENSGSSDNAYAALTVLARAGLSDEGRGAFLKSYAYDAALRHLAGAHDEQERLATIVKKKDKWAAAGMGACTLSPLEPRASVPDAVDRSY